MLRPNLKLTLERRHVYANNSAPEAGQVTTKKVEVVSDDIIRGTRVRVVRWRIPRSGYRFGRWTGEQIICIGRTSTKYDILNVEVIA